MRKTRTFRQWYWYQELEEFVQSSGDDGIVVFSLGSFIRNMTKERSNVIASAFGQIPKKVLWKYNGEKPHSGSKHQNL
ncbi:hypothetical protein MHYP_G00262950 [Metynnis hypsauchen]